MPRAQRNHTAPSYARPNGMDLPQAIAHFLNWASDEKPHEFNKMTEIAFHVLSLRTRPREESEDVKLCKRKMDSAKKHLLKEYGKRTIFKRGLGIRATVDDLDMAKGPGARQAQIVANASKKFSEIVESIDPAAMPNTEEARPWKEWVPRARQQANKLASSSFRQQLLPPGSNDPET